MKTPVTLEQMKNLLIRSKALGTLEQWADVVIEWMQGCVKEVGRLQVIEQKYRRALFNQHTCEGKTESLGAWMRCENKIKHPDLDFYNDSIEKLEDEMAKLFLREQGVVIAGLNDSVTE